MSSYDCLDLCRLCLVKDRVSVPIFEGEGDVRQIFLKITACLPVKVGREDKLPKKICDDCVYKVELLYEFWNTTANAEKQLLQWLGDDGDQDKQGYVSNVMNSELMKQETVENRLDSSGMRTEEHQNNMGMNMMDQMGLTMPIIMSTEQQQITSVPMTSSGNNIQAVPGTSAQSSRGRKSGNNDDDEEESEEEENSDDECDNEEGINVKQENTETGRNVEPSFVNVSIPCDEAGPSGLQQQKMTDMSEIVMAQSAEGDPKSGFQVKEEIVSDSEDSNLQLKIVEVISEPEKPHRETKKTIKKQIRREPEEPVNPEELKCPICDKTFKKRVYLNFHITRHSSTLACNICDAKMPSKYYLDLHIRRHKKEYLCFCPVCDKGFYIKASMEYHMSKHTDEKPFTCEICKRGFGNKVYLRKHMAVHKQPVETQKFTCTECGYVTTRPEYYKRHMWRHTGESKRPCKYCGKLITKAYMPTHVRTHTGEKTEICEFCGKTFSSKAYIEKHRRVHTGERPFQCKLCHKTYTQRESLTVHMKIHKRKDNKS